MSVPSSISSTTSGPITFSGLSTGLDTSSIIQKLMAIDQQPVTAMQNQQTSLQNQEAVYNQLESLLSALQTSAQTLNNPTAFDSVAGTSSNTAVATVSTSTGGAVLPGNFNLTVTALAQAEKMSSGAQTDATSTLNLSGTIVINGKSISVGSTDTLDTIASDINGAGAGVTASIVNGGTGNTFLTLTSNQTGLANKIQVADMTGNVLQTLGLTTGTTSIGNPITNGAESIGLSSETATLQSLLGGETSGTIQVNGTNVSVDFATDSLQSIANNINQNVSGVNATVQAVNNNGATTYQLQITGTSGTPTFTDSNGVLQSLGILQQGVSNELVDAQDAKATLDNVSLTSSTNTITNAIPGTTITLLQGTVADPGTTTLSFSQNTAGIVSNLQGFASAYNAVADFISQNSQIDTQTFETGALFGDPVAEQVSNQLNSMLFQSVPGLTGSYTNLASLGFTLDQNGDLQLNTNVITDALNTDPQAVQGLFEATGQGSNSNISYVGSNSSTHPSGSSPYNVDITQVATKAQYVASTAQTQPATNAETLTFSGALFNSNPYSIILNVGASLQDTVNQINADPTLSNELTASINSNGDLEIDSKKYGTIGGFTVQSNETAGSDNSGIGTGVQSPTTAGLDVQGTINGEAATGSGQYLTGNSGNSTTAGLEIQYTGTQTGDVGTIGYSSGIANQFNNMIQGFVDPVSGLITSENQSLTNQYNSLQTDITNQNAQLAQEQAMLTEEFNNMETAISQLQSEGQSLSLLNGSSGSSSSSGSSAGSSLGSGASTSG